MVKMIVKPSIPRIKADGTATISFGTLIELNKSIFDYLSSLSFDKSDVAILIVPKEDYNKAITTEALRIAKELEEE